MKLEYQLYVRRPLGRILREVIQDISEAGFELKSVKLRSRFEADDLALEETLALAQARSWDTSLIETQFGILEVSWSYGPNANLQAFRGEFDSRIAGLGLLEDLTLRLAARCGGVYGYADEQGIIDADSSRVGGALLRQVSLVDIYWLNYFGPEIRSQMPQAFGRGVSKRVESDASGGMLLVASELPGTVSKERSSSLARDWPVFLNHLEGAAFSSLVHFDLTEVRRSRGQGTEKSSIGSSVGDADEFIRDVAALAGRFLAWCRERGVEIESRRDLERVLREKATSLLNDKSLLRNAIAAYGETIRRDGGLVWRKAALFNRGEPLLTKPGQPWIRRRVILEVLELVNE